ncbi:MAG: iron-sulfur cluster assembly accessory protein [Gammaproteobacteria bacterium]|nr:iron-sulfur cluster assembly accessory protein [Gammaproteobacteria bacterium]MCP5299654.1 iron-sulfur cluster assembly accessory protein [Chromatiaceae bacterium]
MTGVELTESAARHVRRELDKRGSGEGLRVATKKSGCTGFAYVVDYADEIGSGDHVFESFGVKVVVDDESLHQVDGMTIDFVKTNLLNQGFEFRNPNVKDMCGCGESFSV